VPRSASHADRTVLSPSPVSTDTALVGPSAGVPQERGVDAHRTPTAGGKRRRGNQGVDRPRFLLVVTGATLVYLVAPIIVVVVFSFNGSRSLSFMDGFSLQWYDQLFRDENVRQSVVASLEIAVANMVISGLIGTLLAFGLVRGSGRPSRGSNTLVMARLVAPEVATAVALMLLFTQLGVTLSMGTVVVSHVAFSIVYVAVIVRSRLASLSKEMEEAAMDLGCTQLEAVWRVTLPLVWPAVVSASLLVFVFSFDNFVTSFFTSGVGVAPLPVRIYAMLKFGVSPVVNAVGTAMLLLTATLALVAAWAYLRSSRRLRKGAPGNG